MKQRALFLNHKGTFGNQEGIITWCWLVISCLATKRYCRWSFFATMTFHFVEADGPLIENMTLVEKKKCSLNLLVSYVCFDIFFAALAGRSVLEETVSEVSSIAVGRGQYSRPIIYHLFSSWRRKRRVVPLKGTRVNPRSILGILPSTLKKLVTNVVWLRETKVFEI